MEFKVKGLMCHHCEERLEKCFLSEGFTAKANHESGTVDIKENITLEKAEEIITSAGFELIK